MNVNKNNKDKSGIANVKELDDDSVKMNSKKEIKEIKEQEGLRKRKGNEKDNSVTEEVREIKKKSSKNYIYKWFLGINLILHLLGFIMILDFVFYPMYFEPFNGLAFTRVTYLSHNYVNLFLRVPREGKYQVYFKNNTEYYLANEMELIEGKDFTNIIQVDNLLSDTKYDYKVVKNGINIFDKEYHFITHPIPYSENSFYFMAGSCIKRQFPYIPGNTKELKGIQSLNQLKANFFFFLGDFIYADVPIYLSSSLNTYRMFYRQIYQDQNVLKWINNMPLFHIYDDHEIKNNWNKNLEDPYPQAITAYSEYQGLGPYIVNNNSELPKTYYTMTYGNVRYFVMDTRRYRTIDSMLGQQQKREMIDYFLKDQIKFQFNFIISSVPLTQNWQGYDPKQDTWKGYLKEREEILLNLKDINNLFFISGDRHELAVVNLPYDKIEFSLSPINQFYAPLTTFNTQDPNLDSTIFYQRQGNNKFGQFYINTKQNQSILATIVYSDRLTKNNYFKEIDRFNSTTLNEAKVLFNFEYWKYKDVEQFLEKAFSAKEIYPVFIFLFNGKM
ncbi:hypothetical protein K502DRAFT_325118 [Neoconidiobolus thromboides FSU 785]|nr:hypothetical protein K502DRAFT_325118 [Neoconidiobolus thromboides FSU 785]